jgi:hypothetical protein
MTSWNLGVLVGLLVGLVGFAALHFVFDSGTASSGTFSADWSLVGEGVYPVYCNNLITKLITIQNIQP